MKNFKFKIPNSGGASVLASRPSGAQGTARPTRNGGASVLASLLLSFFILNCPAAGPTTPFSAWLSDLVGDNKTNTVTIEAWNQTNTITGVTTNLVLNFSKNYYPTNPTGFITGLLMPGNYRLTVDGLSRGVVFGISSSASTQNLAQLAGVPVYAFQNFTLAQFSDAGTAGYSNAAAFLLSSDTNWPLARITNAGTAGYSNTSAFLLSSNTNWPLARITNAGTAGYSNTSAFLLSSDTNWPLARITNAGTAGYSNASAFVDTVNNQAITGHKAWTGSNFFSGSLVVSNSRGQLSMTEGSQKTLVISNYYDTELTLQRTGSGPASDSPGQRLLTVATSGSVGAPSWADGVQIDAEGLTNLNAAALVGYVPNASISNNIPRYNASGGLDLTSGTLLIGNIRATGTNSFSDIAFRRYANTSLANGVNAAVLVGTNTFMQVSGPSAAFTIAGLNGSPNRDGQLAIVLNLTGYDMTIAHDSGGDPTAANRIYTMTGADRTTTGNGAAVFLYSTSASRWINLSFDP